MAHGSVEQEHDFIIVGGGTAGCVLANRLSEDVNVSVLLIEAGQDRNQDPRVKIPGLQPLDDPEYDHQFVSEPQPGINGRRMKQPRGKALGGSSALNSFALIYPSAAGFDAWASLGNKGWGWNDVKEYFRKFQTVCEPREQVRLEFEAVSKAGKSNGPIQASYPLTLSPLRKAWVETFRTLGLENTSDPLDGTSLGGYFSTNHITNDTRERSHAGVAYFEPVRHRTNLTLVTDAVVQRIVFDGSLREPATATSVAYERDGREHIVKCRKEIVLAAGALQSPQVLELSGIGDAALLNQHNIEVVYNNPNVGRNLQDHIRAGLSFEAADGVLGASLPASDARRLYEEERKGPWAEMACYTFALLPVDQFLSSAEKEELAARLGQEESSLTAFEQHRNDFIKTMTLSPAEATSTAYLANKPCIADPHNRQWISIFCMLSHPYSEGAVHIASMDAKVKPKVDFGYYKDHRDLEIHALHLQTLKKILETPPLSHFVKKNGARLPVAFDKLDMTLAKDIIKNYTFTNYHPSSSLSMLPEHMGGVVDHDLRVYGTTNVRVVDASMMPIIPRGNIITTIYAVAEKAADIISRVWNIQRTT